MNINFKLMKTINFKTLAATIFASVAFVACVQDDDFEVPSSVGTEENQNLNTLLSQIDAGEVQLITIGELKAHQNFIIYNKSK